MSKKVALLLGLATLATLVRLLRRRGRLHESRQPSDPRAGALRNKLADSRRAAGPAHDDPGGLAGASVPGADPSAQPASALVSAPVEAAAQPELQVEAARQQVYEEGRAALEEMRRSGEL